MFEIKQISSLPKNFFVFVDEATSEKFFFVEKMYKEWKSQENCFAQKGEALFAAYEDGLAVAVCGVNIDPSLFPNDSTSYSQSRS